MDVLRGMASNSHLHQFQTYSWRSLVDHVAGPFKWRRSPQRRRMETLELHICPSTQWRRALFACKSEMRNDMMSTGSWIFIIIKCPLNGLVACDGIEIAHIKDPNNMIKLRIYYYHFISSKVDSRSYCARNGRTLLFTSALKFIFIIERAFHAKWLFIVSCENKKRV